MKKTQDFYGREFFVDKNVLIPRPETEQMVDIVLGLVGKTKLPGVKPRESRFSGVKGLKILDVGTGSGCVAITIKKEVPEVEMVAVDISPLALKVAKQNAEEFKAEIEFLESDLLEKVEGEFDAIAANLPYVDRNWEWLNEPESLKIKEEPEIALFAEDGGLEVIFRLIDEAKDRTRFLVLEADPCQHERLKKYASRRGFSFVEKQGFQLLFEAS